MIVSCQMVVGSADPNAKKFAQVWVEEAGPVFVMRTTAETPVTLTAVNVSYPTLADAVTAADAIAGSWSCP
jgi:hypothetical protein